MKPLNTLVIQRLKKTKMLSVAQASFLLEKTMQVVENNWGEESRKAIRPWKYQDGKIYLKSSMGIWRQEITKHKASLLSIINTEIPQVEISDILIF